MWYEPIIKQCIEYEKCLSELRVVCDNYGIAVEDKMKEAKNLSNTTTLSLEEALLWVAERTNEDEIIKMMLNRNPKNTMKALKSIMQKLQM